MKLPRTPLIAIATIIGLAAAVALFILPRLQPRDAACVSREFEGSRFIVCAYDTRHQDMRLYSRAPSGGYLRSFEALQQQLGDDARHVRFAVNAGMYNDSGAPIGLYVQDGDEQKAISLTDGPGNFHLQPNGVFWQGQDALLHIDVSKDYALAMPAPRWATQSVKLDVANVELVRVPDPVLLIERFDRRMSKNWSSVERIHVIDACQALGLPPAYRYERNFGNGGDVKHIREGAALSGCSNSQHSLTKSRPKP